VPPAASFGQERGRERRRATRDLAEGKVVRRRRRVKKGGGVVTRREKGEGGAVPASGCHTVEKEEGSAADSTGRSDRGLVAALAGGASGQGKRGTDRWVPATVQGARGQTGLT
jgi:hypothetical protein